MKYLDTLQISLNGHRLFTKKDFEPVGKFDPNSVVGLIHQGHYICRDCYEADINLVNKICPNKGVGEIKIVKPVFIFHLTDGKQLAVVGDSLVVDRKEYFGVMEDGKIIHLFMKEFVKYVVKQ